MQQTKDHNNLYKLYMIFQLTAFVPEPHSTNQGSDGEPHAAASNEGESYPQNTSHNESSGDNAWEVVSTSNEPATSIDGAANSSAEAFVMESNNTSPGAGVNIIYKIRTR